MSPAYRNNPEKCDNIIEIWEIKWQRMKTIMVKIKEEGELEASELDTYETLENLPKDRWGNTSIRLIRRKHNDKVNRYRYDFKETSKLLLTCRTYYTENMREIDIGFEWATCGKYYIVKGD